MVDVLSDGRPVGVAFLNSSFSNASGYSGKPIHIMVALDLEGRIAGLKLVDHKEPIVLVGIPEQRIVDVLDSYVGFDVPDFIRSGGADHDVDIVTSVPR